MIATKLQKIISIFAVEKRKRADHEVMPQRKEQD